MIINHLNRFLAKHGKVTFTFIGVVMIVPFVFAFGPGGFGSGGQRQRGAVIGEIDGAKVLDVDFTEQRTAYIMRARIDGAAPVDTVEAGAISRLQAQKIINRQKLDHIPTDELLQHVHNMSLFQKREEGQATGAFDQAQYETIMKSLQKQGINRGAFQELMEANLAIARLERGAAEAGVISDAEARLRFLNTFTKTKAHTLTLRAADFSEDLEITDEAAEAYFTDNADQYMVPEQFQLKVIRFSTDIADVSDDEIEAHFAANEADREHLELRHLAVGKLGIESAPEGGEPETVRKQRAMRNSQNQTQNDINKKKLEAALKELEAGKTFEEVAGELNADYTKNNGGSLGWVDVDGDGGLQERFGVAAATAVLALGEIGARTNIVAGESYFQVFELVSPKKKKELDDTLKSRIRGKLLNEKQEAQARELYGDGSNYPQVRLAHIQLNVVDPAQEASVRQRLVTMREDIVKFETLNAELRALTPPVADASEEDKAAHTAERERIESQRKNHKSFFQYATTSDDEASKARGGRLPGDWQSKYDNLPPGVATVGLSMKRGQLSDVVPGQGAFHLVMCLDDRTAPFDEMKWRIVGDLRKDSKKAQELAAYDFYGFLQDKFEGNAASFEKIADDYKPAKLSVSTSGYFGDGDSEIPNVAGRPFMLITEAQKLTATAPLTGIVDNYDAYYIACFLDKKASTASSFWKTDDNGEKVRSRFGDKAHSDLKNEEGSKKAKERAQEIQEQVTEALTRMEFQDALAELEFQDRGEFLAVIGPTTEYQGQPRPAFDAEPVKTLAAKLKEGEVGFEETASGVLVAFIESHTLPNLFEPVDYAGEQIEFESYKKSLQTNWKVNGLSMFYELLNAKYPLDVSSDWEDVFEPSEPEVPPSE